MTLTNLRVLIRSQITDISSQTTIADADLDLLIRDASFHIAELYNANQKDFYKRLQTSAVINTGTGIITIQATVPPMAELVNCLISAYIDDSLGNRYDAVVTNPEGVMIAEVTGLAPCYVSATGVGFMYHESSQAQAYNLNLLYYAYPFPQTTQPLVVEVDVPAKEIGFLIDLVKEMLYRRMNYTIPKSLIQSKYEHEINL